jgi:hypothetical protein
MKLRRFLVIALALVLGAAALLLATCAVKRPSNDRPWTVDQSRLPRAEFNGPLVTVRNVRNFDYHSTDRFTPRWDDRTFDLRQLDSVWFVVEPFGEYEGLAHTFVSFGFGPENYVAISVEIRKEQGESFSPFQGLLNEYEIMYVVGDERDLIDLRANHRKDEVYLYPIATSPERMRQMFVEMLTRANELEREPEFYNTLTNTCTTNIVRHVNEVVPRRIPLRMAVVLPGYSDRLAHELGLIDTELPFAEAQRQFRINDRAARFADDPRFSARIRGR